MHIWTGREIRLMQRQLTFASQLASYLLLTSCLVCDRMGLQEKRVQYKRSERGNIPICFSRVRHMLVSKLIPVSLKSCFHGIGYINIRAGQVNALLR